MGMEDRTGRDILGGREHQEGRRVGEGLRFGAEERSQGRGGETHLEAQRISRVFVCAWNSGSWMDAMGWCRDVLSQAQIGPLINQARLAIAAGVVVAQPERG